MATLFIDPSWSYCGACGQMADSNQGSHETIPPGLSDQPPRPGCRRAFTGLSSHYGGDAIRVAAQRLRPDLPWQSLEEA